MEHHNRSKENKIDDEWEQPLTCPIDPDLLEECEVCS